MERLFSLVSSVGPTIKRRLTTHGWPNGRMWMWKKTNRRGNALRTVCKKHLGSRASGFFFPE